MFKKVLWMKEKKGQDSLDWDNLNNDKLLISDDAKLCKMACEKGLPVLGVQTDEEITGIPYVVTDLEDVEEDYFEKIWQRYRGLPWKICETKRCIIRETTEEDVKEFYRIYREPSITEYMENLFSDPKDEVEYTQKYIELVYHFYGYGIWTVCLKETGEVIGRAGLTMRDGYDIPELGYVIAVPFQRQGIAYEVCNAILKYGKEVLEMDRVLAFSMNGNEASLRLLKRLGFAFKEEVSLHGKLHDCFEKKLVALMC